MKTVCDNLADEVSSSARIEFAFIGKDGAVRWVELTTGSVHYRHQPALLVGILDITARKNAELALRHSEAKFRALFEEVPICLYQTTPDGKDHRY